MKTLYLIGGAMGVGKTSVCRQLQQLLPHNVFLDGDWCWDMRPFTVTDETKAMVQHNITALLNNFLACSTYENVIFCWVMHLQEIIDEILGKLDLTGVQVHVISLTADAQALTARFERDVAAGLRQRDGIARSLSYLPLYDALDTVKLDVSCISAAEAAGIIAEMA